MLTHGAFGVNSDFEIETEELGHLIANVLDAPADDAVVGRVGYDPLSEATTTQADPVLSEEFGAGEISAVRFDTALRGYRMDQVDAVLDQLQDRIAKLEAGDQQR